MTEDEILETPIKELSDDQLQRGLKIIQKDADSRGAEA